MTYQIISYDNVEYQKTISDFLDEPTKETVDVRTIEGQRRYKEIYGYSFSDSRTSFKDNDNLFEEELINRFIQLDDDMFYLLENLDERQRRLVAGFFAKVAGSEDDSNMAEAINMDKKTIRKGREEIENRVEITDGRIRVLGGGRPLKMESDPHYRREIQSIIDDDLAGDPMNGKTWIRKTLRRIKDELSKKGIHVSINTIRDTLKNFGVSLKQNVKTIPSVTHPQRDEQFQYLTEMKKRFLEEGKPVISVDSKKREQVGNFKNSGRTWRKDPYQTLDHDFLSLGSGILIPFGIYDIMHNRGYIYGGTSSETSEFIVDALSRWWIAVGQFDYPEQNEILILCDSGGANGYRRHGWKWELQEHFVNRFGLTVTVCHYPPGTSKWNPIEHRLFSFISLNWAGEPLTSYEKALSFIHSTTTSKGLTVDAHLINKKYQKGIKISADQLDSLNLTPHSTFPKWNYSILPQLFSSFS